MSATTDYTAEILAWLASEERYLILEGDSAKVAPQIPDCSVDAVVSDPPAGIAFMGKAWDEDKGGKEHWIAWLAGILREAFRVLKPGGFMYLWAIPCTSHWTAEAGERAGFIVAEKTFHLYGQGFPKSTNVSKSIDAAKGAEREIVGSKVYGDGHVQNSAESIGFGGCDPAADSRSVTAPATPEARRWHGFGTALKPAAEEWILFQKPIAPLTSAEIYAATGWDHWQSKRRLDTAKQREKAAKKYGVEIPAGGELEAIAQKALHPGVMMREELRWRHAIVDKKATRKKAIADLGLTGNEGRAEIAARLAEYDAQGGERAYVEVGEWRILWSEEKPYKPWKNSSIAANVLAHGTGAINIDAARVGTSGGGTDCSHWPEPCRGHGNAGQSTSGETKHGLPPPGWPAVTSGRWPANLVLSHAAWEEAHCPCGAVLSFVARFCPECGSDAVEHRRAGCCAVGERRIRGAFREDGDRGTRPGGFADIGASSGSNKPNGPGHADPDGLETVTAWECLATCACGLSTLAPSGGAPPRCRCGRAMSWACPVARLDEQSGDRKPGWFAGSEQRGIGYSGAEGINVGEAASCIGDTGGASRFFNTFAPPDDTEPFYYCAKPSTAEREAGCERLPRKEAAELVDREEGSAAMSSPRTGAGRRSKGRRNTHPTLKGIDLMRHFCRLACRKGGIVLDLFGGSGTTVCAGALEEQRVIAIEMDSEFVAIGKARAAFWAPLAGTQVAARETPTPKREEAGARQVTIFDLLGGGR